MIQYGYTPDTTVIPLLIQISAIRYRLDTLQTQKPFYFSFRFNYQIQVHIHSRHGSHSVTYSTTDTVQIRSRHGCHSVTHSEFIPSTQLLHTHIFLCYPDTIQIHSRHGSHSVIHTDSNTPQTRRPFCCSYKSQLQIQSRYASDTVAILSLIQNLSLTHSCPIHIYFSVTQI